MVDFHGWEMPIQYAGIIDEHIAVRTRVGLFDLSHMGRVRIQGSGRRAFLLPVPPVWFVRDFVDGRHLPSNAVKGRTTWEEWLSQRLPRPAGG